MINNLPEDNSLFEEKIASTVHNQPKQTYDYAESVKSKPNFSRFHSTYTVIPKRKGTSVRQEEGHDQQHQTEHHKEMPSVRASGQDKLLQMHHSKTHKHKEDSIDSWIDHLDPLNEEEILENTKTVNITMQMLIQQRLPRLTIPNFDGTPELWVDFISKFYDMVHKQPFLDPFQKHAHLIQNLHGEPLKAVSGFDSNYEGYVQSLQRLKYMFGNRSLVAQATIRKLVAGKQLENDDIKGLNDYYYTLSHCMNTLKKMKYYADMYSSDVLRQALKRLPPYLLRKWGEYCLVLRRREEPSLQHLEIWLQDRVMAARDPNIPTEEKQPKRSNTSSSSLHLQGPVIEEDFKETDKQRFKLIRLKKCCFNCLSSTHQQRDCSSKYTCLIDGCKQKHHTSLHNFFSKRSNQRPNTNPSPNPSPDHNEVSEQQPQGTSLTSTVHTTMNRGRVFLQVVPIKVTSSSGNRIKTYALLDGGSQCTILRKDFCQILKLQGDLKQIDLGTLKGFGHPIQSKIVDIEVSSMDNTFSTKIRNVFSVEKEYFHVPSQKLPDSQSDRDRWDQIKALDISDVDKSKICVLIGADAPRALVTTESINNGPGMPLSTKTPFGWAIVGSYNTSKAEQIYCNHLSIHEIDDLNRSVQRFWEIESFGTSAGYKGKSNPLSIQDTKILNYLKSESKIKDGHYEVPMIWKEDMFLPDSLKTAKRRFDYLTKRFKRDDSYFDMYKTCIDKYIRLGHARKLTKEETEKKTSKTIYLTHHGVINENKPGKVQVVFDAAAKSHQICLNSNLLAGPDLLNKLVGILLRFREHPIAITGDIEGMFNQVRLNEEDREAVRFLWKDCRSDKEPSHYQMLVHIFGAKDSPTCANFALKQCAENVKEDYSEEAIQTVKRDFYMDDLIKSVDDEEKGVELVQELASITQSGGFNLHKFNSNSQKIVDSIPIEKRAKNIKNIIDDREIARALGLVMSKSRVAPVKQISLPRLELEGALLAANLAEAVVYGMETEFKARYFWTDSMLNLQYINNEVRRFKAFVANRVTEIRESTSPQQWHHINGGSNPADLATRGMSIKEMIAGKWLQGPDFLYDETIKTSDKPIDLLPETHEEVKKEKMSDLPADRLEKTTPFSNTGVDYFGPITVKILRSRAKRWGCIFTCLTTRAVHLEVAPSLETDDFLNVFKRFVNRRGCPKIVRSDCGTNFKGADRVLGEEWMNIDRDKVIDYATKKKFEWKFNPPEAPHMGGVWERMIRSVKTTLQIIFSEQSINDFTLMTAFTQVEALINVRPLTANSDDIHDLEALTPNHFLVGRADTSVPVATENLKTSLRKRWRQTQELSTQFWNRWQKEYLPSLTKRSKWLNDNESIKVGEMVLVLDKRNERGMWPLGRVLDVYASRDGRVRKVIVGTNNGTFTRPVVKLSKLELFES
ncbi:uncharacterized protein [Clytia hemisphaerica]|uniref:uncharacterized protein n=1 Tax=Clytia hemisphaerica TaxID=252671 RepID=UPI0034D4519C